MENKTVTIREISKPLIIIASLTVFSCTAKKNSAENTSSITKETVSTFCPKDGKCTTQLLQHKSLNIKTDEFGATYYQLSDNSQTSVVLYQYKRNVKKELQDAGYTEEILFEIDNTDSKRTLTDLDLQKTKMLFGRLCFCRGQTGYYKVTHGNLKLEQKNKDVNFSLDFTITQVPQIIHSIAATIR